MESQVTKLPKSAIKLTITVSPKDMGKYFAEAVKQVAAQVNIEGFRKGKAPRKVLEDRVGKEQIEHQALELAVTDSYYQAVKEHDLKPISRPQTDAPHNHGELETKGLTYTATVPVLPAVDLGKYQSVKVKPTKPEFSDKQVDEAFEQLRRSRASQAQVDRPAKDGDQVEIDFVGKVGGKEFPGGKSENHPLTLGQGNFIPGFEEHLGAMRKDQVKTFKVKFPKDYHEATLAGKDAEFTVTMKQIQEVRLPEATDKFAEGFGAKSLLDLKTRLRENLQQEKEQQAKHATELAVVEKVVATAKTEVPDALVEEELTRMLAELRQQIERQGLPYEKYLEQLKKTEDDIRKEQRGEAERRVKISLVLNTIQEAEKVAPTDAAVKAEVDQQLAQAPDQQTKDRVNGDEFKQYVRRILANRMVVERLVKRATE